MATLDDMMLAAGVTNAPAWFSKIKTPNWPFPHQMEALKDYLRSVRFLDASDPGTGKTFPAQLHAVLMAGLGNKVVFTMPPKLIRQFHQELLDFFPGIEDHLTLDHLDVGAVQKDKRMTRWDADGWPDILLIGYDTFRKLNSHQKMITVPSSQWKMPDGVTSYWVQNEQGESVCRDPDIGPHSRYGDPVVMVKGKGLAKNRGQLKLREAGYNVYFFDEAHALCNPTSQLWKATKNLEFTLGDDVALYLMTGTPVPTHLENVYGIISLINPDRYANKSQFDRRHVILRRESKFRHVVGYRNEEEIYEALYQNARRVQKRDVLPLKDPLISSTPIRLTGPHKKLYDKVIRDRFAVLGDNVLAPDNDSALRMLALQLISCPDEFDPTGKIGKSNELSLWLDDTLASINPANHKVIIFAYFQSTVRFLSERLWEWNPAVMNGATTKGWDEVKRFKEDPSCRVFIVNWGAGGAGLNLQVASHIIFYEVPTSPKDAKQAIARCDRSGQENVVNVYFPRVVGTLFDKNFKNLLKNEQQNNKVVRDKHDLLYQQLGVAKRKCA